MNVTEEQIEAFKSEMWPDGYTDEDIARGLAAAFAVREKLTREQIHKLVDDGKMFVDTNPEANWLAAAELACPHCGGSGHKDDVRPLSLAPQVKVKPPSKIDVLREWFGGDRYARDYEYIDANFSEQAQRVADYTAGIMSALDAPQVKEAPAPSPVAGEHVDYPKILYVCETCWEGNSEACGSDRDRINVTPDGRWLCEDCRDGEGIDVAICRDAPKLYTDPSSHLRAACEGIADDYMTSEHHHPGYVLIPTAKFEAIHAALAATEGNGHE
jgi:hypothetical protein